MTRTRAIRHLLMSCLVYLLCASVAWADTSPQGDSKLQLVAELDRIFSSTYPANEPGASILVRQGDEILLAKGYGMADLEHQIPIAKDTVFRLGSITKQFTAVGIMMLEKEGKLSLDTKITDLLPDYPAQPHGDRVDVTHLLTHTSGIPSYTGMAEFWSQQAKDHSVAEMLAYWQDKDLEFEPGSRFAYNNSGYFLLGAIIEEVTGQSYAEFVEQRIFQPLGMKQSYYGNVAQIIPLRARGYSKDGDEFRNAPYLSMTCPYAAGSLLSTVGDLEKWDAALSTDRLLPQATLEKMWTEYQLADGSATDYGFGWALGEYEDLEVVRHGGGIHGFSTIGIRLPERDIFVAVLSNNPDGVDPSRPAQLAISHLLGSPIERRAVTLSQEQLQRFEGVYRIDETETRVVRVVENKLQTQRGSGRKVLATPSSENEFFYDDSLTTFRFEFDAAGNVRSMWMKPWGQAEEEAVLTDEEVPEEAELEVADVDPALYERLEGRYELAPGFVLTVTREGDRLMTQATGQGPIEILPSSETEFFNEQIGGRIVFDVADGQATGLTLHQGGREMPAKRLD